MSRIKAFLMALLVFGLSSQAAWAVTTIFESFLAIDPYKVEFVGGFEGGQFGSTIASGDFNADGVQDVVIAAPFASTALKEWNGAVSIVFGEQELDERIFNIGNGGADVTFYGAASGDQLGTSLVSGDFNHDGIEDLAIGAYNAAIGEERRGKVYLFYGREIWDNKAFNLDQLSADVELIGQGNKDNFGLAMAALDINQDNIDDLMVGAPNASSVNALNSGKVYGFFGAKGELATHFYDLSERLADVTFHGQRPNERFGSVIDGGFITGAQTEADKFVDLVIGAYRSSDKDIEEMGRLYFYKGSEGLLSATSIKKADAIIQGATEKAWLGFDLEVYDIDGDGVDDIAFSSFPYLSDKNQGSIAVFYGGEDFVYENLVHSVGDADVYIEDSIGEAFLGASISVGDFNKDGRGDLVMGAPSVGKPSSQKAGEVYVLYNSPEGLAATYQVDDNAMTSYIYGEQADDWCGYTTHVTDFNQDGLHDLIVGCRYADSGDSISAGKVFMLLGHDLPFGESKVVPDAGDKTMQRGEFIAEVIESFDLSNREKSFLDSCTAFLDFCLFNFTTVSTYDGLQLEPDLVLYPDVGVNHAYYDEINLGTMLGLVNGYINDENSPFHPENEVSRIQALKVILTAGDLIKSKYKFELIEELGSFENLVNQPSYFSDVNGAISHMWWYARYTNFAAENGIIDYAEKFRPDEAITMAEFEEMLSRTVEYLNTIDEEAKS